MRFPPDWNSLAQEPLFQRLDGGHMPPKEFADKTVGLSQPCTILSSLRDHYGDGYIQNVKELKVHVLGATDYYEMENIQSYLLIFENYLPECFIKLYFIGLCIQPSVLPVSLSDKFQYSCWNCTYASFISQHSIDIEKPDIAVCFNPGFHSFLDSWDKSVSCLLSLNVFSILTAYSQQEIDFDSNVLTQRSACIVSNSSKNVFRSLLPIQDPCAESCYYFDNCFILCFHGLE